MIAAALAAAAAGAPSAAEMAAALDTALLSCEQWVLAPRTHMDDPQAFPGAAGLSGRLQSQRDVPEPLLPPVTLRQGLQTWRVPAGPGGVFVTVSDVRPFCHLAGGGPFDLRPGVLGELNSAAFRRRWRNIGSGRRGEMASATFAGAIDRRFTIRLSHAAASGGRTDRVQLIATAYYDVGK